MTYERRKQIVSSNCPYRVHCSGIKSCPNTDCSHLDEMMAGWKAGQQDTIEEIVKYISELPCKSDETSLNQKMLLYRIKQLEIEE